MIVAAALPLVVEYGAVHLESIELDRPLAARLTEAAGVLRGHLARMGAVAGALAALFAPDRDALRLAPGGR